MNKVILIGRLGQDPKVSQAQTGAFWREEVITMFYSQKVMQFIVFIVVFFALGSVATADVQVNFSVFVADHDVTSESQIVIMAQMPVVLDRGMEKRVTLPPGAYMIMAMWQHDEILVMPLQKNVVVNPGGEQHVELRLESMPGFEQMLSLLGPAPPIAADSDMPVATELEEPEELSAVTTTESWGENGGFRWLHSPFQVDWQPDEEADKLAMALLEATSVPRVIELLYEVLGRLGIGVYNGSGQVLLQGNEESLEDFYLYDFQLWIIARNFFEQRYVPLENIVSFWGDLGVTANDQRLGLIRLDARYLEQGLRSMRQWAEEYPEEPNGFLIRLVDGLGDREQYPFDLLEEMPEEDEEPSLDFAGMIERTAREELHKEMDALKQEGVVEEGDVFATEEGIDSMMSHLMAGDFRSLIGMFLDDDDEDIDEILSEAQKGLAERLQDPNLEGGEREVLVSSQETIQLVEQIMQGDGDLRELSLDMIHSSLDTLRAARDGLYQRLVSYAEEAQEDIAKMLDRVKEDDAQSKINAAQTSMIYHMEIVELDHELHILEQQLEIAELSYERFMEEDEDDMFSGLPLDLPDEEKPSSDLALDALQALLLQIDFLFNPRTEPQIVSAVSWRDYLPKFAGVAHASGGPGPDLFGNSRRGLDISFGKVFDQFVKDFGPDGASRLLSRLNVAEQVLDILHGLIVMSAHTVELKASYEPAADATLQEGIRLLGRGEGRWDKYIQLEITITFDPPEAMRAIEAGRMAATRFLSNSGFSLPLTPGEMMSHSIARKLADYELPEPGPQEGVLVKINHSMDWYRLTRRDEKEWYDFAQWLLVTDENGVARARLFMREDSELSMTWGGIPKAAQDRNGAFLRVHPMTQVPDHMLASVAEVTLGVADHMQGAFPGLGTAESRFHIEKLEPTMWVGTVAFTRKINAGYDQSGRPATAESRHKRAVAAGWNGEWTVTLRTEVLLDRQGRLVSHGSTLAGSPPPLHVEGNESGVIEFESYQFCDERDRKFEEIESYEVKSDFLFQTNPSLRVSLQLHNWLDTYRVVVLPQIPPQALLMEGPKYHTEDVCDGQQFQTINHLPEQIRVGPRPEILQYLVATASQYPRLSNREYWKNYERDVYTLSGSARWPMSPHGTYVAAGRPIYFGPFRPNITVENHVLWNLRRHVPADN